MLEALEPIRIFIMWAAIISVATIIAHYDK